MGPHSDFDLEGLLWKEGKHKKSWHRRHFRLIGSQFTYRQYPDDVDPLGLLIMTRVVGIGACDPPESAPVITVRKERRFYFYVETAQRRYNFSAGSESERAHWLEDLRLAAMYGNKTSEEMHYDLFQALENSNFRALRNVLRKTQVHVNVVQNFRNQYSCLHLAVLNMQYELLLPTVKLLIRNGANLHRLDSRGNLPVHLLLRAAVPDHIIPTVLDVIMDAETDCNICNSNGNSLLHLACLRAYRNEGTDSSVGIPEGERRHLSVRSGSSASTSGRVRRFLGDQQEIPSSSETVNAILNKLWIYDFNAELVNNGGFNPLACAVLRNNETAVRFLLDRGFGVGDLRMRVRLPGQSEQSGVASDAGSVAPAPSIALLRNVDPSWDLYSMTLLEFARNSGLDRIATLLEKHSLEQESDRKSSPSPVVGESQVIPDVLESQSEDRPLVDNEQDGPLAADVPDLI